MVNELSPKERLQCFREAVDKTPDANPVVFKLYLSLLAQSLAELQYSDEFDHPPTATILTRANTLVEDWILALQSPILADLKDEGQQLRKVGAAFRQMVADYERLLQSK